MGWSAAAIFVAVVGYGASEKTKEEAKNKQEAAVREQKKAGAEQAAMNKAQEMAERRKQVREERVRRSRIMQAAENTGTAGSSGETGGIGGMATQLSSNLGFNAGMQQKGVAITAFNQTAMDYNIAAQRLVNEGESQQALASIFSSALSKGAQK